MLQKIFILLLINTLGNCFSSYHCGYKEGNEILKTQCVAGRRFFARLDEMPTFRKIFSEEVLTQSYTFPWIAQVFSNYAGMTTLCVGSLINDRFVLTAQRCCLPPLTSDDFEVILGYTENDRHYEGSSCSMQTKVLNVILHPNYYSNAESSYNDIALLRIPPIAYTKTIYPIGLPTKLDKFMDVTNQMAESAGYQRKQFSILNKFEKITMKIISNAECGSFNTLYKNAVHPDVLCTNSVENFKPRCTPSPGTPLMTQRVYGAYNITVLLGIASWSDDTNTSCMNSKRPIVYVRIDKKLPWIFQHTEDALYCNK